MTEESLANLYALEQKVANLEKKQIANSCMATPPQPGDKNYPIVREIFKLVCDNNLQVREVEIVLAQVRAVMGYTPIRWSAHDTRD